MPYIPVPLSRVDDDTNYPVAMTVVHVDKVGADIGPCPNAVQKLIKLIECRGLQPIYDFETRPLGELVPVRVCDKCLHAPQFALWNGFTPEGDPAWVVDPFPNADLQANLTMPELYLHIQLSELVDKLFPCQKEKESSNG